MRVVIVVLGVLVFFFMMLVVSGIFWSWSLARSPLEKEFLNGRIPSPLPDGFYRGKIGISSSWTGKQFDLANMNGINMFHGRDTFARYPFKMEVGKALVDQNKQVLRIDYNIPANLPWIRLVLDEAVETRPGHFLGKLHVRIIPMLPFTLAYFELDKE